jgi:hypothetical protein
MIKLGQKLKSFFGRGIKVGRAALEEALQEVQCSESEMRRPHRHRDSLAAKQSNAREIDIMDLWEAFYGSVRTTCFDDQGWHETQALNRRALQKMELGLPLEEAEVYSNAFQLLTQAKLFTTMQAAYELTPAGYEALFDTFDSPYKDYKHQIPSDAPTVDYIPEGGEYQTKNLVDRWCQTKANKFGARIELTRETMITDRTGQVVEQAEQLAMSNKYREDELAQKAFCDLSNSSYIPDANEQDPGCYYPEGTNVPLYRTTAGSTKVGYEDAINKKGSGANLLHWDAIATAIQLLRRMVNPRSGQYIEAIGNSIWVVVPIALEQRARLLTAVGNGALTVLGASTDSITTRAPDPIRQLGVQTVNVMVWNKLPETGTLSQSTWYVAGGMVKRQFRKHRRWDPEFTRASVAQLGGDDFKRDVITAVRAGFNAGFRSVDDKYVIQNVN